MITPFGPPNDELDRLNTSLDAQVTGKRAPETSTASDTEMLAATAHYIALQPETQGETPSTDTLDSIWRNVMHAHAIPERPSLNGTLPDPTPDDSRIHDVRDPEPPTVASWISLAAVAALLLGIVGGAWGLRKGNDDGGSGDNPIRLAATALDETPVAQDDGEWLTWVTPEECTAEPMTTEQYAEIMREEPDISDRSYDVVGPADPETAEAVASAARGYEACSLFGTNDQVRSMESPENIYYRSANINRSLSKEEKEKTDLDHGEYLSSQIPERSTAAYGAFGPGDPPGDIVQKVTENPTIYHFEFHAYDPSMVVELEDGRMALPLILLQWEDAPWWRFATEDELNNWTWIVTRMLILTSENGTWQVDEQLAFCTGTECDTFWASQRATPEPSTATSVATPIATPED